MLCEKSRLNNDFKMNLETLNVLNLNAIDNMEYMTDYCFKSEVDVLHDCMWSGSCDKDSVSKTGKQCSPSFNSFNHHWNNGKHLDSSIFFSSPFLSNCSFFDMFTIAEEENSLGEVDDYDEDDELLGQFSNDSSLDELKTLSASNSLINDHSYDATHANQCKDTRKFSVKFGSPIKASLSSSTCSSASTSPTLSLKSKSSKAIKKSNISNGSSSFKSSNLGMHCKKQSNKLRNLKFKQENGSIINSQTMIIKSADFKSLIESNVSNNYSTTKTLTKAKSIKSMYPERRKEHNNSEKKRRDHLRNAFLCLKEQIPKLKDNEKKAARVTILKEATSYVSLLNDKHRYLEKTKSDELIKKENLLKRLKLLQVNNL